MLNYKIKLLIIYILLLLNLNAENLKDNIFTSAFISTDGKTFIDIKDLKELDSFKKKQSNFIFKININKEVLKDETFYLRIDTNIEDFVSSNVPYTFNNNLPLIKIDKNINETIIINFDFKQSIPFFEINTFNEFEYKYIINNEKLLFGISYGIIICAFLYNFVFFLYNREKSFLYYSILQISFLSILIVSSKNLLIFNLFEQYGNIVESLIIILISTALITSILFNMEFLNTKKYTPKIHKFLWLLLLLHILDFISLLTIGISPIFEYIPSYIIILILLFSAFAVLKKGYKPAIFYIIGWLSLFIFVFLFESSLSDISDIYLLHIGIPLESLLFSFALGFKIKQIEMEKQRNEGILITQSKLASMGEMVGNIAHQWRQPLTHLSYIIMNLKAAQENDKLDKDYLEKKTNEATNQIEFMSHTIEDFRNFFKVSKQKEVFSLVESINESINLLKESFESLNIKLGFSYEDDLKIETYKGELSQVIFNLLNNAKEEFIKREIGQPKLSIKLLEKENNILIQISDNAGGIDEKIIKKIFEPYFTTKDKGLGIGLYMSKMIIEKNIGGKLEVENIEEGALFTIYLNTQKNQKY
ncbi:sensor histidine kinase [Arcobacter sp. LA11]|uniref:sensor histidine kinase n=1 Tax=Arcobacter sp. LA11 TaxID=1898176 RepID=UPI0009FB0663|nr:sensor histidine kinase [Arcobacter sp. LA11]